LSAEALRIDLFLCNFKGVGKKNSRWENYLFTQLQASLFGLQFNDILLVICQEDSQFSRESQSTTLACSAWYVLLWKKWNVWILLVHFSGLARASKFLTCMSESQKCQILLL